MFKTFTKISLAALVAGLALTAGTPQAAADEQQIQVRQALMKSLGGAMGGLKAVVEGKAPTSAAGPLGGIVANLAVVVTGVFPAGSGGGKSYAKDEIWSKPANFNAAVAVFQTAAGGMAEAAKGGDADAIKAAFGELGKTCGGYHKPFRTPKS